MDTKAEEMAHVAKDFKKNTHELERIMYYRNVKMNIIICLLVTAVVLYFTFPLVSKLMKNGGK